MRAILPIAQVEFVEWPAVAESHKGAAVPVREVVPVGLLGLAAVAAKDQRASFFIEKIRAGRSERRFPFEPADYRPRMVDDQPVHAPVPAKEFPEIGHCPRERHICPAGIPVHGRGCAGRAGGTSRKMVGRLIFRS